MGKLKIPFIKRDEVMKSSASFGEMLGLDPITLALIRPSYNKEMVKNLQKYVKNEDSLYGLIEVTSDIDDIILSDIIYNLYALINTPNYGMFKKFQNECGVYRDLIKATFQDVDDWLLSLGNGNTNLEEILQVVNSTPQLKEIWQNSVPLSIEDYLLQKDIFLQLSEQINEIHVEIGEFFKELPVLEEHEVPETDNILGYTFDVLLTKTSMSPEAMKDFVSKVINSSAVEEIPVPGSLVPRYEKHYGKTLDLKRQHYSLLEKFLRAVNILQRYTYDVEAYAKEYGDEKAKEKRATYKSNLQHFLTFALNSLSDIEKTTGGLITLEILQFFKVIVLEDSKLNKKLRLPLFNSAWDRYEGNLKSLAEAENHTTKKSKRLATLISRFTTVLETLDIQIFSIEQYINYPDKVNELENVYF